MSLKDKVRQMRDTLGYSQIELAERAGITSATISRIESGKTRQLKSDALSRLAKALNLTTDDLVSNDLGKNKFNPANYDPNLRLLLNAFRHLTPEKRKQLLGYAIYLKNEDQIFSNYIREDLTEYMKG